MTKQASKSFSNTKNSIDLLQGLLIQQLEIRNEWNLLKSKSYFKFEEYTDDTIEYLKFMVNEPIKHDGILEKYIKILEATDNATKANSFLEIYLELKQFHYQNRISNNLIFNKSKVEPKLKFLLYYNDTLTNNIYWEYLRKFFLKPEKIKSSNRVLKGLFSNKRKGRKLLMNLKEFEKFNTLDNNITIYRCMSKEEFDSGDYGVIWTLNENNAKNQPKSKFYANEGLSYNYGNNPIIHSLQIEKDDIVAYFKKYNSSKYERVIYVGN
ncbi:hypothetical protein OO009_03025 [Flavobacteriaceae bacterium KMM 6897]|nr:hypothetical protein [Flavobacteriaceae bacterium KMM 6897]